MSIRLNDLARSFELVPVPGTFQAIIDFCEVQYEPHGKSVLVGTVAAVLAEGLTGEFYSPILPRGLRLNTSQDVFEADLEAQRLKIEKIDQVDVDLIVSGHAGTRDILAARWPEAAIAEGNVSLSDISGKVVAGTLPPFLATAVAGYYPATITAFDYSKDGDLSGDELRERLVIHNPVRVVELD